MRCALFARYSSKMQDEMSMDAQVFEMEAFCSREGLDIIDRYLMPEVRSSDLDKAPEFQRMLDDAKAKKWKVLLCHKLDRLGRDRDMVVMFKAALRKKGIEIRSVVENLSDSIEHRMLEQIHEVFSDYYARNLGNETRKGHRQLVRQGYWKGGLPAWGLTVEAVDHPGAKKPRKRLAACPVRGPIMAEVFARVAKGDPPEQVRRWVANQTSETEWKPQAFYARIHNPIYYGRLEYGRTALPAGRPRKKLEIGEITVGDWGGQIVSKELWDQAQAVIAAGKRKYARGPRTPEQPYSLSGLVRCADCGSMIVGSKSSGHRKYRCSDRKCTNRSVRAEVLEKVLFDELRSFMDSINEEELVRQVSSEMQPVRHESKAEEARLRGELAEVKVRQRRLMDAIEQGGEPQLYVERLKELASLEGQLAEQIALCQATGDTRADLALGEFFEIWLDLKENLPHGMVDAEELRIMLRHAFDVEISIPKEEGQLFLKLASVNPAPKRGLVFGRSAPTICHPRRIMVRRFSFPFLHPFQNRVGGIRGLGGVPCTRAVQKNKS